VGGSSLLPCRQAILCECNETMGISTDAPIDTELDSKRAGDAVPLNGRKLVIEGSPGSSTQKFESCPSARRTATVVNLCGVPCKEVDDVWPRSERASRAIPDLDSQTLK
jgi:hypothetical protein